MRLKKHRQGFGRAVVASALVVVLGLGAAGSAAADDIDDRLAAAQQKAQQRRNERAELEAGLEDTNDKLRQAVLDLDDVEARLPVAQAELDRAQADVERARREAEILAQRLQDAQDEEAAVTAQLEAGAGKVEAARADIAQMAREAARGQGSVSAFGLVTGAQSTQDFLSQFAVSSSAARSQARTLTALQDAEAVARNQEARLEAVRVEIAQLKDAADAKLAEAQQAEQRAENRKAEVESLIAKQRRLKAAIEDERDTALAELNQNDAEQRAIEADIKQLYADRQERDRRIEEQRRREEEQRRQQEQANQAAGGSGGGTGGGSSAGGSGGGGSGGGGTTPPASTNFLGWPVAVPHITSHFGMRLHPVLGIYRLHAGTDFRAYCGTPILASQSGIVVRAQYGSGPGNNIMIDHGTDRGQNVMTRYLHLSRMNVGVGQWVNRGQVIGLSGSTGTSTACHLHFEVWVNGTAVNPVTRLP